MINKNDRLKAGLQPLLAKTLENPLAHRIAKEFPRIGGETNIDRSLFRSVGVVGRMGEMPTVETSFVNVLPFGVF